MKKIKRKIALLLAFVMVLAVLPVNVEAVRPDPRGTSVLPTDAGNNAILGPQPTPGGVGAAGWFVGFNHPQLRNILLDANTYAQLGVSNAAVALVSLSHGQSRWLQHGFTNATTPTNGTGTFPGATVDQLDRAGVALGGGGADTLAIAAGASGNAGAQALQREVAFVWNQTQAATLPDGSPTTPLSAGDVATWFNIPQLDTTGTILWHSTTALAGGAMSPSGTTVGMAAWLVAPGTSTERGVTTSNSEHATLIIVSEPLFVQGNLAPGITWPIAFTRTGNNSSTVTVSVTGLHADFPVAAVTHTVYSPPLGAADRFNTPNPGTANTAFHTFIDIGGIAIDEAQVGGFDTPWWRVELNLNRGFSFDRNHTAPGMGGLRPVGLGSWRPNTGIGFGTPGAEGISLGLVGSGDNFINVPAATDPIGPGNATTRWALSNVAGDANRRMTLDFSIDNPIVGAGTDVRVDTVGRINDGIRINDIRVVADDTARTGDAVTIEIVLTRWVQTAAPTVPAGFDRTLSLGQGANHVFRSTVTVAQFNDVGVILELAPDQDPENFRLTSGMREWTWAEGNRVPTDFSANNGNWDAVIGDSVDPFFHRTARVRLTETVPGVLPFTGLTEVIFSFGEGVQVLGVTYQTNAAQFVRPVSGGIGSIAFDEAWFVNGNANQRSGDLDTLVRPGYVSMRPHLAEQVPGGPGPATPIAWIEATFYLSIQPGYEHLHGQDIVATASFRGGGAALGDFGDSQVVAIAYDPITVSVQETVIQDDGATAWGQIRTESIGNITITETEPGALRRNRQVWVGVEGGVSLGWGQADLISVRATGATTDGTSGLSVGPVVVDQRGFWVTITGESGNDIGSITFTGVEISGALVADNDWGIIVAGDAVADNFGVSAFTWDGPVFGGGTFTRIGHGLFTPEPYLTAAFSFDGTDLFAPAPGVTAPGPAPAPGPGTGGAGGAIPVVLSQNLPYFIQHGPQQGQAIAPSFEMRAFGAGQNASAFVSVGAIADILGWTAAWDQGTQTATLTTNDGRTIVFVNGQPTATVNGQTMQITNADGTPSPTYINNDRLMLSLLFFQQNLGVSIIWMGGTPGAFQIMIVP